MDAPTSNDVPRGPRVAREPSPPAAPRIGKPFVVWSFASLVLTAVLASCQSLPKGSVAETCHEAPPDGVMPACVEGSGEPAAGCACGLFGGGTCGPNMYVGPLDRWRVRRYAQSQADHAWHRCQQPGGRGSCHYREGFNQAFLDLADGGDGTVPAVPPERYWWCLYRSSSGHQYADDWFAGYEAGVETARAVAFCPYPEIPLGPSADGIGSPPIDYTSGRTP